ncbi:2'-5' RNA ligase family protein [Anaerosolibacter sp.]|uniref:2'-5' RNA ligase family protein n=1 Tax=Anaerosolibacter sp. TaxID=1872527 RepID=UPI0039F00943
MENLVYLVAVPKGSLLHCSQKIQKFLWDKYALHQGGLPEIHLTLEAIAYKDREELQEIRKAIRDLLKKVDSFEIMASGFSHIPCPYNCITIHIVKTKELKEIYQHIHEGLKEKGFQVREFSSNEIIFHISLAGIHGRQWTEEESRAAWKDVKDFHIQNSSLVDEIQLWFPDLSADKKVIDTFKLREGDI